MARTITIEDDAVAVRARIVIDTPEGAHSRVTSVHLDAVNGSPGVTAESLHLLEAVGLHLPRAIGERFPSVEEAHVTAPVQRHEDALPEPPAEPEPTQPAGEPDASTTAEGSPPPAATGPDASGSPPLAANPVPPAAPFRGPDLGPLGAPVDEEEDPIREAGTSEAAAKVTPATVFNERAKAAVAKAQDAANGGRKHRAAPADVELSRVYKRLGGSRAAVAEYYEVPAYIVSNWMTAARKRGAVFTY